MPPQKRGLGSIKLKDYSSALAYELTSQFRSISSCCGVVHSMVTPWDPCC
jgi:hypothetical protein